MRYAMVIDLKQCVGCDNCTVACKLDNETGTGIRWGRVVEEEAGQFPNVRKMYLPLLCMHCENAECVKVCPTQATYKDARGVVLIDYEKCMGCKYCVVACPYSARHFNEAQAPPEGVPVMGNGNARQGAVEKCDFCHDRLAEGKQPRCVEVCPYEARTFGDRDNPDDDVSKLLREQKAVVLKPECEFGPSVYYRGVE
jgi:Fe-S-cluster-containing dehydrogenase component